MYKDCCGESSVCVIAEAAQCVKLFIALVFVYRLIGQIIYCVCNGMQCASAILRLICLLTRDWNPPLLGTLPDDFLRILPSQRSDPASSLNLTLIKSSLIVVLDQESSSSHNYPNHRQHHHGYPSQSGRVSRSSASHHNGERHGAEVTRPSRSSPSRKLQRRKTTGEVNVVLGAPHPSRRSPQNR